MGDIAIKVENISKAYQLGDFGTGTLSRDIERKWALLRGKEDPFLKIGEANDRATKGSSNIVWSLKDINFDIKKGDAVGVIGRNGAGKSTLLKLLSRVTTPTTGSIKIKGRIASLLEVGTGFHPELSGRENIFLNGAILGMRKKEISRQFDEIVDFAGVERYIDTPVKRYSSGMYVRLAFAVAAYLDSEILIVDEVLAVGDADFQRKCIGKMNEVSKGDGRTVLFVSHNMGMISQLCNKSIYLQNGVVLQYGNTENVINNYLSKTADEGIVDGLTVIFDKGENDEKVLLSSFEILPHFPNSIDFPSTAVIIIVVKFKVLKPVVGLRIGFDVFQKNSESCVFRSFNDDALTELKQFEPGEIEASAEIPSNLLKEGEYVIAPAIGVHNVKWLTYNKHKLLINVININGVNRLYSDKRPGVIAPEINWQLNEKN